MVELQELEIWYGKFVYNNGGHYDSSNGRF